MLADAAETCGEARARRSVKTGRITALDMPGQISRRWRIGIITETESAMLRDYDRRVMEIIHVDDFTTDRWPLASSPSDVARHASATHEGCF